MTVKEKWYKGNALRILAAFILNALFLVFMLKCFYPVFETNDDTLMSKFADGQLAEKTAFIPFINICLGFIIKTAYTLLGDGFNWYTFFEYLMLYLGFSAVTWVLLRRFRLFPALVMTAIMLCSFGADAYLSMNFSKPAGVGTVGGLTLMLYAMHNEEERIMKLPLVLGTAMTVIAYAWRYESFFGCAFIMAGLGLVTIIDICRRSAHLGLKVSITRVFRYAAPFLLVMLLIIALYGINTRAWNCDEYADYTAFDLARCELIDFDVPSYEAMKSAYDRVGWDETAIKVFKNWNFYDTQVYTTESFKALTDARDSQYVRKSIGECVGIFIDKCIKGFTGDRPFTGFVLMLALFLACGKREAKDWVGFFWMLGSFFALYMIFIYNERYLANRIDIGLFMALAVGLAFLIDEEKLNGENLLCLALAALAVFIGYRSCRNVCIYDSHNTIDYKLSERQAMEKIGSDRDHLYFYTYLSIDDLLYTPTETVPNGSGENLVFLGNWNCRHPQIKRVLDSWGIDNPYADMIDNDSVYLIDRDIDLTMKFIHTYRDKDARAELVEPLSTQTGLKIYRILG